MSSTALPRVLPSSSALTRLRKTPLSLAATALCWVLSATPVWAQSKAVPLTPELNRGSSLKSVPHPLHGSAAAEFKEDLPNVELTRDLMYRILGSEMAAQEGQIGVAYRTYMSMARTTKDPRLARRAVELAFNGRLQNEALEGARLWYALSPRSPLAQQVLQLMLVSGGLWPELPPILTAQLDSVPEAKRGEAILNLQTQLARYGQTIEIATALESALQNDLQRPEAQLALARAKFLANDKVGASTALEQALKRKPDYEPAVLFASDIDETQRPASIARLQRYLKHAPQSRDARLLLAKLLVGEEQFDAAQKEFEQVYRAYPKDSQVLMALALLDIQRQQFPAAEARLKEYLALTENISAEASSVGNQGVAIPGKTAAYLYLAQLAEQRKDYVAADQWLNSVEEPEQRLAAQVKRAQLLTLQGRLPQALDIIAEVRQSPRIQGDAQLARSLAKAEIGLLIEGKSYQEAVQKIDWLLIKDPKDVDLQYDAALALEHLGQYEEMEQRLRKVLRQKPDHFYAMNALGYSLADRNVRLPEAHELLEKAVALAPQDGLILDSLGWVKFRMGYLADARALLEKAYALKPEAEIGAHLGEVQWLQGNPDQAKATWRAAEKIDATNDTLKKTMARFLNSESSIALPNTPKKP